jgi:hypothetical protein
MGARGPHTQVLRRFKGKRGVKQVIQALESDDGEGLIKLVARKTRKQHWKSPETKAKQRAALARGQAKKGEIRNPYGRPSGQSISEALRSIGKMECTIPAIRKKFGEGLTYHQVIAMQAEHAAATNDRYARDFIADRTEGRVPQTIITDPEKKDPLTDEEKAHLLDLLERAATEQKAISPSEGAPRADA